MGAPGEPVVTTGSSYPWIDRGVEYPLVLGPVALLISLRGGGPASLDRAVRREP